MNRLAPLRGLLLRVSAFANQKPTFTPTSVHLRYYSKPPDDLKSPPPPHLAKPTRYTLPSHPSRAEFSRARPAPQFPLSPRASSSNTTHYPSTLPPPGTFIYWFLTSRRLHFYLSLGILSTLAAIASITNFLKTSPYAQLVPEWRWGSPGESVGGFVDAVRMHLENENRVAAERRKERTREVERRGEYRRKHGLEQVGGEGGLGGWGLRRRDQGEEEEKRVGKEGAVEGR
ncbi:hypothetical protein EV426DRAFT_140193 [Tirmania nivea]|nr:hypothetical protein EV426DRAFT_140193 [Tirmania nivea]